MKKFSEYSDVELFDSFSAKQKTAESAFAEFYSRYSDLLWNYIRKFLGHCEDVNDLFQDIMISFFEGGKENKGKVVNPKSFLYMTAKNKCINYIRDKRDYYEFTEGKYGSDQTDYSDVQFSELINQTIQQMNFDDREILILRYYQGWSVKDISELHDKDEQYMRNKIWRARKKLRTKLKPFLRELKMINKIVLE